MNKISLQDYEGLHYDKEKLREACKLPVPEGHLVSLFGLGFLCVLMGRIIDPPTQKCTWRREEGSTHDRGAPGEDLYEPKEMGMVKGNGEAGCSDMCALGLHTSVVSAVRSAEGSHRNI